MTFMKMSSNDNKSCICQFFIKVYCILSIQYMYKISCKMDEHFLRYSMLFHRGPTRNPPVLRFSKKPSPGGVKHKPSHQTIWISPLPSTFPRKNSYRNQIDCILLRNNMNSKIFKQRSFSSNITRSDYKPVIEKI